MAKAYLPTLTIFRLRKAYPTTLPLLYFFGAMASAAAESIEDESSVSWLTEVSVHSAIGNLRKSASNGIGDCTHIPHPLHFFCSLECFDTHVNEDNASTISLAQNKEQSKRAWHYQLIVHFLKELSNCAVFCYEKFGTRDQVANTFTKTLP